MLNNSAYTHEILPGRYDLVSILENNPKLYPFLLETTAIASDSESVGFDILFAFPQQTLLKYADDSVSLNDERCLSDNFFDELDRVWRNEADGFERIPELPFSGGWFVYLGYELADEIEPTLQLHKPEDNQPVAFAVRIPVAIIYDHVHDQTHLVIEHTHSDWGKEIHSTLNINKQPSNPSNRSLIDAISESPEDDYLSSVAKILDYIREGDVFQVNLSRQWQANLKDNVNELDIYRKLRKANPAPYSAIAKFDQFSVLSSSPERLICTRNDKIETRPIAGTRPRGVTNNKDADLQSELISNQKERAEHIMLIDLERNDLGRICNPGSIKVDEFMVMESYAHVHHIVSNVSGKLNKDVTPGQTIKAVFPGGTITGCPKVRCMEIISELEQEARGAYTGSLGYLNHNGDMDLNILIRSLTIKDKQVSFRAGAGIVADSIAEREVDETRAKAKGIIMALQG